MNKELLFKKRSEFLPGSNNLTVRIPGSSANLGPGFDSLALAYKLYCTLGFQILDKDDKSVPLITLKGSAAEKLKSDENNLLYHVFSNLFSSDSELLSRIRFSVESDIPFGRGLGSSASAITGAIWAAYSLLRGNADNDSVLSKACEIEGHADNAGASLLGGLVVCANRTRGRGVHTQKLEWPSDWATVVFVPPYVLSTKKSRSVLPKQYTRTDAVHNVQKVSLLLAALQNRDETAMRESLFDRFHEPYRSELVPELSAIKRATADIPTLGTVLSGAGPSVLTIVQNRHRSQLVECLSDWSMKNSPDGLILDLDVDQDGLKFACE